MYQVKKRINFFDCDPAGILFYGNIFHLCHSVYEEFISTFKLKENYWKNEQFVVPIIRTESKFYKPVFPGEEVDINLTVSDIRSGSFELCYIIKNGSMEITSEVKTVHVFVSQKEWKKIPIPADIFKKLTPHR